MSFIKAALLLATLSTASFGATVTYGRSEDSLFYLNRLDFDPALGLLVRADYEVSAGIDPSSAGLYRVPWAPEHDSIITTLTNIRNDYSCGGVFGPFSFFEEGSDYYPDVKLSGNEALTGVPASYYPGARVRCTWSGIITDHGHFSLVTERTNRRGRLGWQ
jgi:hypothetical protein